MTNIRRFYADNFTYFFTNVTFQRSPILLNHAEPLLESIKKIKSEAGFNLAGWVILPDHCHLLIHPGTINISLLMRKIKLSFSSKYRKINNWDSGQFWQDRFWDHIIRNQDDMNRHLDYIHFNPVKHGLVIKPFDDKYSSIHEYEDDYSKEWGIKEEIDIDGEFGE